MSGDRPKQYRALAEGAHWTPAECAAIPITVQWALWAEFQPAAPVDHFQQANLRRELAGLPPITEGEYEARQAAAAARVEAGKKDRTPLTLEEAARRVAEWQERQEYRGE